MKMNYWAKIVRRIWSPFRHSLIIGIYGNISLFVAHFWGMCLSWPACSLALALVLWFFQSKFQSQLKLSGIWRMCLPTAVTLTLTLLSAEVLRRFGIPELGNQESRTIRLCALSYFHFALLVFICCLLSICVYFPFAIRRQSQAPSSSSSSLASQHRHFGGFWLGWVAAFGPR